MRHRIAAALVACAVLAAVPAGADAAPYPDRTQLDQVREYVKHRGGVVGVAIVNSRGKVRGVHGRQRFATASVVKAMLLVAYLRRVANHDRELTRHERSLLGPMIRKSSNSAADWAYQRVGDWRLRRLARRAGMHQFDVCCRWTLAQFSARDQAKFFWRMDDLTPKRFRPYADRLLRRIVPRQSWGIPRVARKRGFRVRFKGGWRDTTSGELVHQVGFLSYGNTRFTLAVLTDGNPSKRYGIHTIRGITRRLVTPPPD
ncbi:MAG TPA: hypothetical protein VD790_05000 [Thermoleophilaceae bacterium]|nr:hypothetical protein [Thermoleophilaceae bacterium]